jgi:hypothetical protein
VQNQAGESEKLGLLASALIFEEGETMEAADQTLILGQFAVKCYPYVEAGVFDAFSPREREMITGNRFDHTHTPRLEAREGIPEAFFYDWQHIVYAGCFRNCCDVHI